MVARLLVRKPTITRSRRNRKPRLSENASSRPRLTVNSKSSKRRLTRETRRLKPRRTRSPSSSRLPKLTKKLKKTASKLKSSKKLRPRTPRDRRSARPRELKARTVMKRPRTRLLTELLSIRSKLVEREVWDLHGQEARLSALLVRRTWEPGLNLVTLLSKWLVSELTSLVRKLKRRKPLPRNLSLRPRRKPLKSPLPNQRSKPKLMSNLLLKSQLPNTR